MPGVLPPRAPRLLCERHTQSKRLGDPIKTTPQSGLHMCRHLSPLSKQPGCNPTPNGNPPSQSFHLLHKVPETSRFVHLAECRTCPLGQTARPPLANGTCPSGCFTPLVVLLRIVNLTMAEFDNATATQFRTTLAQQLGLSLDQVRRAPLVSLICRLKTPWFSLGVLL